MRRRFWAPGRVNLIGDHTDYAGGLVLPIAVDLGVELTVEPAARIVLSSGGSTVDVAADGRGHADGWGRFPAAVAAELAELGRPVVGMAGEVASNLPIGAGLSSSAALEVAVGLALCALAEFTLAPLDLAAACRRAELRAVGVPCGILDQAASLLGRAGCALLLDCGTLEHRYVQLPDQLAVLVVDSGERQVEQTPYAARQRELAEGMAERVRHLETENRRVRETAAALESGKVGELGRIFRASHDSLRDDYGVSTSTLDSLVERAYAAGALGARLTGAGFGGSIVVLARREEADDVLRRVLASTGEGIAGRLVHASGGAREL